MKKSMVISALGRIGRRITLIGFSLLLPLGCLPACSIDNSGDDSTQAPDTIETLPSDRESDTEPVVDRYLIKDCVIAYERDNELHRYYALALRDEIKSVCGKQLSVRAESSVKEGEPCLQLRESAVLTEGRYRVSSENGRIMIEAGSYYGFYAAIRHFAGAISGDGEYVFADGTAHEGVFTESLKETEASCRYAYDKPASLRVMFYNVLWDKPEPAKRNLLQAEMIEQYMPDVLGLEEYNQSKHIGAGENNLSVLLGNLGYVEAIDPRVKNVDPEKYGVIGDYVTVDGEGYYTYYNCVPLFYHSETTIKIDAGFYWYEQQVSGTTNDFQNVASKSLTWGVFESKASGQRYIVINTHMCTDVHSIRTWQANKVVELIETLTTEQGYDYPVILGGDMNRNFNIEYTITEKPNRTPCLTIFEDAGLYDLQKDKDGRVSEYLAKNQSYHRPYPIYDTASKRLMPDPADDTETNMTACENSVDHIFIGNTDDVRILVFGVVVDPFAMAGSDHYPIFVDLDLNT